MTGPGRAGFTIVEVLVVMAIIAGLVGASAYTINVVTAGDLKASALEVTSAIKYTYSQSVINNSRYRLVFDVGGSTYRAELVHTAVEKPRDPAANGGQDGWGPGGGGDNFGGGLGAQGAGGQRGGGEDYLTREARELAERKRREDDLFDEDEDNPFGVNRRVSYERVQDGVLKPGELKDGVRLVLAYIGTNPPIEDGEASINFYPSGFQDPAILVFEDAYGERFSLQTEPLTGRVLLRSEELEPTDDFGEGESDE